MASSHSLPCEFIELALNRSYDDSFPRYIENLARINIATLGPSGTSSEAATSYLLKTTKKQETKYSLFPSYEAAFESLVAGESNLLVVANAYQKIDQIYMSPKVRLLFWFYFETPIYGVARKIGYELPKDRVLKIATHHAPSSLIPLFLSELKVDYDLELVSSTSEAAIRAQRGEVDLCVTNAIAAQQYHLQFIALLRLVRYTD